MVIASTGQRLSQLAHRMHRSSSLMIADHFPAGSPPQSVSRAPGGRDSSSRGTSFRHSVGQTSAQPPQRVHRSEAQIVFTPQSRQRRRPPPPVPRGVAPPPRAPGRGRGGPRLAPPSSPPPPPPEPGGDGGGPHRPG